MCYGNKYPTKRFSDSRDMMSSALVSLELATIQSWDLPYSIQATNVRISLRDHSATYISAHH